jgi:hypothetical protein
MSYDLKKREIVTAANETVTELFYVGSAKGDFTDLDVIDAENLRVIMKQTLKKEELSEYEYAAELTNLPTLKEKGQKLKMFYYDIFDVVFKFMNKYLWKIPPAAAGQKDKAWIVKGGKESPQKYYEAYDRCVEPISNALMVIVKVCINDLYPRSLTNLASEQAMNKITTHVADTTAQLTIVSKEKKKSKP